MNENICTNCGCIGEDLHEVRLHGEDMLLCEDCLRSMGFVQCDDCGKWVLAEDSYRTADGRDICEDCYEEGYFTCEECGDIMPMDDCVVVNDGLPRTKYVCQPCADNGFFRCDDCGGYFTHENVYRDDFGTVVCHDCYDRHDWNTCDECGRRGRDLHWHEGREEYYCDDCFPRRSSNLRDYGYKPTPDFKYRSSEKRTAPEIPSCRPIPGVLTYGVELEVDKGDSAARLCDNLATLDEPIYMKHDGSLDDEGVEIVTHPCSLAYHQYELRWAEIIRQCKSLHYSSHEAGTCGLHIHVGRKQMGSSDEERSATAANLVLLTVSLWDSLVAFSRRNECQLSRWAECPCLSLIHGCNYTDAELANAALRTVNRGRYQAVNLTNSATVEFRIFRGTLKRGTLIAAIQLVDTMTRYAMTHTAKQCYTATWADVLGTQQFKELNAYCQAHNL